MPEVWLEPSPIPMRERYLGSDTCSIHKTNSDLSLEKYHLSLILRLKFFSCILLFFSSEYHFIPASYCKRHLTVIPTLNSAINFFLVCFYTQARNILVTYIPIKANSMKVRSREVAETQLFSPDALLRRRGLD